MPKLKVMPEGKEFDFASGKNLMEIMLDAGLFIDNACGGKGLCGKCRVKITEGGIAGAIAGRIMGTEKRGFVRNVIIGIIGANLGGFVASFLGLGGGVTGFNLYSLLVAVGGACLLLLIVRLLSGGN